MGLTNKFHESYWKAVLELINAWSKLRSTQSLYENYRDDNTRHKVDFVVRKYYGGIGGVEKTMVARSSFVNSALAVVNQLSRIYGIEPVTRDWLDRNLLESADYDSLREKVKRLASKDAKPVSIKEIPPRKPRGKS